ncbi:MAG: hypothetical protein JXQ29_06335 [Planctomycetes bacterium]|nr:hypothetical protein [Planctomycetota bacterium]
MGSERGIAMIWWVIVLLVLFLVTAGLAYDRYSYGEERDTEVANLKAELKSTQEKVQAELQQRLDLSKVVGFASEAGGMVSEPGRIDQAITRYKDVFQEPGQDPADRCLEKILERAVSKYNNLAGRLRAAEQERDQARSNEDAARDSAETVKRGKEARIAEIENEKQQVEDRLTNTTQTKDQRIEELQGRLNQAQEQLVAQAAEHKTIVTDLRTQVDRYRNMAQDASERNERLRRNNDADGKVLARVVGSHRVYVDIGARAGLTPGTYFEVYELGKGNDVIPKGRVVIQEVHGEYSVAAIDREFDTYKPVAAHDLVRNPLFETGKRPKFFLMGDMTGRLSNQQTEALIEKSGGEVVRKVTADVDFIVLGRKESESALPFENREEWELARIYKIEIIDPAYLLDYLTN